jgi:hypothetical protein
VPGELGCLLRALDRGERFGPYRVSIQEFCPHGLALFHGVRLPRVRMTGIPTGPSFAAWRRAARDLLRLDG